MSRFVYKTSDRRGSTQSTINSPIRTDMDIASVTIPTKSNSDIISQPMLVNKWQFQSLNTGTEPNRQKSAMANGDVPPLLYQRVIYMIITLKV